MDLEATKFTEKGIARIEKHLTKTPGIEPGAPEFKKLRGASAEIEYSYIYCNHLNRYQRLVWRGLSWLSFHLYRPILQKFKL